MLILECISYLLRWIHYWNRNSRYWEKKKTIHLYEESKGHFSLFVKQKESKIEYSEYNEVTGYKIDQSEESKMTIKLSIFEFFFGWKRNYSSQKLL